MPSAIATTIESDKPPSRRRWIPLSLRLFLAIVLTIGLGSMSWIAIRAFRQESAIQGIRHVGGSIYQIRDIGPAWLRDCVGRPAMLVVDEIEGVAFVPDEATHHRRFRGGLLSGAGFWTDGPSVDDSALTAIRPLDRLKILALAWTNVTDAGMVHVGSVQSLEELYIPGTDVSDTSVAIIKQLPRLRVLDCRFSRITITGRNELQNAMPELMILSDGDS